MFEPENFYKLVGIRGFSEQLLKNHFSLYQGYVINTNKLLDMLNVLMKEGKTGAEFSELKRRFGWEFNGMRLHELYFGNMRKNLQNIDKDSEFFEKIIEDFGSFENWEKDFKATGMMRGIGWVILYYDPKVDKLFNILVNEHDSGHLSGCKPLLVTDLFEHAFMIDYGLKKADYIEAFFKSIDWNVVANRFKNHI